MRYFELDLRRYLSYRVSTVLQRVARRERVVGVRGGRESQVEKQNPALVLDAEKAK